MRLAGVCALIGLGYGCGDAGSQPPVVDGTNAPDGHATVDVEPDVDVPVNAPLARFA